MADKIKELQKSIDSDFASFEKKVKAKINSINDPDIGEFLDVVLDTAMYVAKSKVNEQMNFVQDKSLLKKQDNLLNDLFAEYRKFRDEEISKEDERIKVISSGKGKKKKKLPKGLSLTNRKKEAFDIADEIVDEIEVFVKYENDQVLKKAKGIKASRGIDIAGKGLAGAITMFTGSAIPVALWEGRKLPYEVLKNIAGKQGKGGRLATAGQLATGAAGFLGGSPGSLFLSAQLGQLASRGRQKAIDYTSQQEAMEDRIANLRAKKTGESYSVNNRELKTLVQSLVREEMGKTHSAKVGGVFDVMGGPDSGIGAMIKNLRVHKGEQVVVRPAKDTTITTLKSIDSKLATISRASQKMASVAEESYEDQQDATARAGLAQKKEVSYGLPSLKTSVGAKMKAMAPKALGTLGGAGLGFGAGSWLSGLAEDKGLIEKGGIGSKIIKGGGALLGGLAGNWLGGKLAKAGLGTGTREGQPVYITNWNEAPDMGGGIAGGLAKKVAGKGLGKIGGLLGKIGGKAGGLLGGVAKFAGPIGLAITAGMAAKEGFEGWNNAEGIAGLKKGQKATTLQKAGSALAGAASSLTMGLVSPQTLYKGISAMAQFSPAGLLFKGFNSFFGRDQEEKKDTKEVAQKVRNTSMATMGAPAANSAIAAAAIAAGKDPSTITAAEAKALMNGPVPISNAMALSNIDSEPIKPSNVYHRRPYAEGKVDNIIGNTQGMSTVSEAARLKVLEAKADVKNMASISKGTENAINKISLSTSSEAPAPNIIILTGDMDSFASRLAKSY